MLDEAIEEGVVGDIPYRVCEHPVFVSWCGYVNLPDDHPWRRMAQEDIPVRVHGGLTYGPDGDGWIGFDMMHAGDRLVTRDGHDMDADLKPVCVAMGLPEPRPHRRTVDDARRWTLDLARQADDAYRAVAVDRFLADADADFARIRALLAADPTDGQLAWAIRRLDALEARGRTLGIGQS